jgi:hypothetical protein
MSYTHYNSVQHVETQSYSSTTSVSLVVQELTDSEVSSLSPSVIQASSEKTYEIRDEDRLTEHDFYSLMHSEDESVSESESDVEYHWFPSLLKHSSIQFLEDGDDTLVADNVKVEIEEQDSDSQDESEQEEFVNKRKRRRHHQKHSKRHKKSRKADIVPVEVVYVKL